MVLVDTSVWIDHFRRSSPKLEQLLLAGGVSCHPVVIGELACGVLRRRETTLDLLRRLPRAAAATDEEALRFIEDHRLFGCGLSWADAHLLAAATLSTCALWTGDRRLHAAGRRLRIAYTP
jgi:predicted nucleic acid-binding protein